MPFGKPNSKVGRKAQYWDGVARGIGPITRGKCSKLRNGVVYIDDKPIGVVVSDFSAHPKVARENRPHNRRRYA